MLIRRSTCLIRLRRCRTPIDQGKTPCRLQAQIAPLTVTAQGNDSTGIALVSAVGA